MATVDTVYRVAVKYDVQDHASRGLSGIDKSAARAAKSTQGLNRALKIGVGYLASRAAFGFAKKNLIDFNSTLQQTKIQTAALLDISNGKGFTNNLKTANSLVADLQRRAAKSTATTAEMANFMGQITGPVTQAGLGVKDLTKFTSDAVVAAKLFGEEMTAGLDIKQALTKGVSIRDRFAMQLLNMAKVDQGTFNSMDKSGRLKILQGALSSKTVQDAAAAQGKSWAGVTSTLKDNIQLALGKIGLPLMKRMTAEAQKMVDWINAHPEKIEKMVKSISDGLMSAFSMVKSVFSMIVEHRTLLMSIAQAVILSKGIGGMVGGLKSLAPMLVGLKHGTGGIDAFGLKLGRLAPKLGLFGAALGAGVIAINAFAKHMDERQEKRQEGISRQTIDRKILGLAGQDTAARKFGLKGSEGAMLAGGRLERWAKENSLFDKSGAPSVAAIQKLTAAGEGNIKAILSGRSLGALASSGSEVKSAKLVVDAVRLLEQRRGMGISRLAELEYIKKVMSAPMQGPELPPGGLPPEKPAPTTVNVKLTIPARDPERFAHDFNRAMSKIASAPTQAKTALRRL